MRSLLAALLVPLSLLVGPLTTGSADAAAATVLKLSATTVAPGTALTVSGTFRKPYAGRKVAVQVATGGTWSTLATRKADAKGAFSVVVRAPNRAGTVKVRATVAAKGAKKPAATTAVASLKVTAKADPGDETQPWSVGQWFGNGSWSFMFGRTDTDAWPELSAADPDNVAPAPGWTYVLVPVTFRNDSATADEPYWPTDVDLMGGDGGDYSDVADDGQDCGTVPHDWSDAPELAPGASVTLNVCAVVPTAALPDALWSVFNDDADEESYVKLS